MRLRGLDLFAGIGGGSLAMQAAGIEVVAHAEIEPFPCRVLEHRFPGVPNPGDVSKVTAEDLEPLGDIDVVSFGSPCQDWSVAGKRLGLKGHRSSLFHEAVRIIRLCQPRFAVFENVPGLFSSAGGWDFAAVLDEMAQSGALDIAWRVLDAQWFGVPQRRRRIFLIADFRGERAGEILSLSEGVQRYLAPSREAGQEATRGSGDGAREPQYFESRVARNGRGAPANIANALKAEAGQTGKGDASPLAMVPAVAFALDPHITANGEKSHEGHDKGGPTAFGMSEELAFSHRAERTQAVALTSKGNGEAWESDVHTSLSSGGGGQAGQGYPAIRHGMAVRRLTPTECERLQGFPDGWTDIPGASDSARYRALGNAWAVPVGEWVMKGITEMER